MQYDDFDISIRPTDDDGSYRIAVLHSPAGEAQETVAFPFDGTTLALRLTQLENALLKSSGRRRRAPSKNEKAVLAFGGALFRFLMTGDVGQRYAVSVDRCRQTGRGLRLKLRIHDPALAALPWEFLYDRRFDSYLALSQRSPLVRYLELPLTPQPLRHPPPLRMLGVIADPVNLPRLDVAGEKARVGEALADLTADGTVDLHWMRGQGWRDLQKTLRRGPWHIVHFIGHGGFDALRDEGYLVLAKRNGEAERMVASKLALLLGDHDPLRVVLLNSCDGGQGGADVFSSTAATLVRSGVPAVVAMQYEITDVAAIEFSRTFYEALAEGLPLESAVGDARKSITLSREQSLEWGTPAIFTHAPDGVLFELLPPEADTITPRPARRDPAPDPAPAEPERGARPVRRAEKPPARQRRVLTAPAAGIALPHSVAGAPPLAFDWCWVPGGPFTMGSEIWDSEKPVHQASVDGFWLARAPVTNAQFRRFIEAGGYAEARWWTDAGRQARQKDGWTQPRHWDDDRFNDPQQPVVGVSWYEAAAFCAWAAEATGEPIRLPTEAEWEKAARGTDGRTYPWGEAKPTSDLCTYNQDYSSGRPTSVGQHSPAGDSPYGCTDMAGNVYDWTTSWFQPYPGNQKSDDAYGETHRVVRGGSWGIIDPDDLRCAFRLRFAPQGRIVNVGFRCASTAF